MDLSYLSDHYARQYRKNQKTKTSARTLPFRFSLRDQGRLLLVEDQGSLSTCWAITGIEAAAQTLYDQEHGLQLSSLHAAWYTLTGKEEEILQMNADPYGNGGSCSLLAPSLAAWKGPIREEKLPMSDFDRIPTKACAMKRTFICRMRSVFLPLRTKIRIEILWTSRSSNRLSMTTDQPSLT